MAPETKKAGRPRKYKSNADRVRAYRQRQREEGTRLDGFISSQASWRLRRLAEEWGCSRSEVIDRLLREADLEYGDVLFSDHQELTQEVAREIAEGLRRCFE